MPHGWTGPGFLGKTFQLTMRVVVFPLRSQARTAVVCAPRVDVSSLAPSFNVPPHDSTPTPVSTHRKRSTSRSPSLTFSPGSGDRTSRPPIGACA